MDHDQSVRDAGGADTGEGRSGSSACRTRVGQGLPWVVFAVVLALYTFGQVRGFTPAYAENDPDGYLFLAKRMALGKPLFVNTDDPFLYQQHMWVETTPGRVTSKYPPGYPALMAIAYRLGGDRGMFIVSPVMGGLALAGAWLLFRLWLKPFGAVMALLTLALLPQYSFYSAYLLTHVTSLCLTTWGMYFLWRWRAQPQPGWGLAAGAALGASLTVRPTDALFVLPLAVAAVAALWNGRRAGRAPWGGVAAMLAAWGLFVGLQALYNHTQFGAINLSGYALSGEQDGFSLAYFTRHFGLVMGGLNREFLPVIFPLGLVGLALWGSPTDRAVRLLWFVPVLITYTSYYWVNDNWSCLRFFMSTLPVCIGSAYAVLEQMPASRVARTGAALMVLGLFVTLNAAGVWNMVQGEPLGHNPRELARVAGKLASQTPANAVIFSRAPLGLSMGPRAAYTVYDLDAFRRGHGLARFREIDPRARESEPRQQAERTRRLREFYERTTDQGLLESERTIVQASLEAGRPVFFLVPVYQCDQEKQRLGPGGTWKTVEEWDVDWSSAGYLHRERWGLYRIGPRASAGQAPAST